MNYILSIENLVNIPLVLQWPPQMNDIRVTFFWSFFFLLRAEPAAYGGSQAKGLIRVVASSLCHSHSNAISELLLQPTPQLMAMPDPYPTEQGQGPNLQPYGS